MRESTMRKIRLWREETLKWCIREYFNHLDGSEALRMIRTGAFVSQDPAPVNYALDLLQLTKVANCREPSISEKERLKFHTISALVTYVHGIMLGLGTGAPIVQVYHERSIILPDVSRVLACLYEKDIKFETHTASYKSLLRLQASSHAPVPFYDGPKFLEESREICRYIAEKYEHHGYPFLFGKDALERASVEQWLHNEEHAFNPPSRALFCYLAFPLDEDDDGDDIDMYAKKLEEVLEVYEQRLGDSEFLAGNKFTLADLVHLPNSHYIKASNKFLYLYDSRKNVRRWWDAISSRDSWKKVLMDMKRVEEQEELRKQQQQQQQQQKEHPRISGHPIRIDSQKKTSAEPRTILVPRADTVLSSPRFPQTEEPFPIDTFPNEAHASSSQNTPIADITSAVFTTPPETPSASVRSTPVTSKKYPIPVQSTEGTTSPATAKKPPITDAAKSITKDNLILEPPETDVPTRHAPTSSVDVSNNLDVSDYYPSNTDEETPYIKPTPRKTSETLNTFDGSKIATGHAKTRSISAKKDSDKPSPSDLYKSDRRATGVDSQYKESVPYSGRTSPKLEPTDTSASKLHTWSRSRDVAFKPKEMIGQDDQDTFKETESDDPSLLRDQQSDTWQAASTLPEQEVNQDGRSVAPPSQTRYPSSTPPSKTRYQIANDARKQPRGTAPTPEKKAAQDDNETSEESKIADEAASTEQPLNAWRAPISPRRQEAEDSSRPNTSFQKRYPDDDEDMQVANTASGSWQISPDGGKGVFEDTKLADSTTRSAKPLYTERSALPLPRQAEVEDAQDKGRQSRVTIPESQKMVARDSQDTHGERRKTATPREQPSHRLQAIPQSRPAAAKDVPSATGETIEFPDTLDTRKKSRVTFEETRDPDSKPRAQFLGARDAQRTNGESRTPTSDQRKEVSRQLQPDTQDPFQQSKLPAIDQKGLGSSSLKERDAKDDQSTSEEKSISAERHRKMIKSESRGSIKVEGTSSIKPPVAQDNQGQAQIMEADKKANGSTPKHQQDSDVLYTLDGKLDTTAPANAKTRYNYGAEEPSYRKDTTYDQKSVPPLPRKEPTSKVQPTYESLQEAAPHGGLSTKPSTIEQWQRASVPLNDLTSSSAVEEIDMSTTDHKLTPMSQQATPSSVGVNQMPKESGEQRVEQPVPIESEISGVQSASTSFPGASTSHHGTTDHKFAKQSIIDERVGEPTKIQASTPDSASARTKRAIPNDHEIGGPELVSTPDGQISEAAKPRHDQATLHEDVHGANLPTHDVAKDVFKDAKAADYAPSRSKPIYTQRPTPVPRHREGEDTMDIDRGIKSRETVPDRQKMVERRAGRAGAPVSDHLKAIPPSRQAAAEDALGATGDTVQSPDILDTSKKSRGTYEAAKAPGSTLSKAQSLGAQDVQHTTGESTTPTAGQRKDVSTKPQPDVQDGLKESKLSATNWNGLGSLSSEGNDAIETETNIAGEKSFSTDRLRETSKKSEPIIPKEHPADYQGSVKEKTSSTYQKKPLVARDSHEQAQAISSVGEKADGSTRKHQQASGAPNTSIKELNASEPARAKTNDDLNAEEPYIGDTIDDRKVAPPLLYRELTSQVQPPSEPSHDAALRGDLSGKPSTIDQWQRTSAPLHGMTTSSGDDEVATSTVDQKPTPTRKKTIGEKRAETSGAERASPSFPGASVDEHATIGHKYAEQSIIDERVGKPIQMQKSSADAHPASEPTKRGTPEGHKIGDLELVSTPDGQISEQRKAREDPATAHEDVYDANMSAHDEKKVADLAPSSAKPMYTEQPALPQSSRTQVEEARDKRMQSRETIPEPQKVVERKKGISGQQPSDRQKAIHPSVEDAPTGGRIQPPYSPDSSKKSRGTFEEAIGLGSTLPKAQALDAQDSQLTKGESTIPTADRRKDSKDAKDDGTIMTEEKSFSTERLKEMFQESESTTPKTQPTGSQGYSTVDKTSPVYQKGPLAAQESQEEAQIIQAGEKVDSSTPEHQESSGAPYAYNEKLSDSAPARPDIHDDHSAEEPYEKYTTNDKKVAPYLPSREPASQVQPLSEPLQRAVPDGDLPSKSSTIESIDQWRHASAPLHGVSTDSADAEVDMASNNDQKSIPASQEATLSSPVPIGAETSDVGRTAPSLPEASRADNGTIDDKFAKQSNIDERVGAPKQMQEPITAAHPASASMKRTTPDGHEAVDLKLFRTPEGQRLEAAKATQDAATIHDVHDAAIDEKTATYHANGDELVTEHIHDRQAWTPTSTQAQPTVETPYDSDSSQYVHTGDSAKTKLAKPHVTHQEATAHIAGPTSMDPQRAGTLPTEVAHSQQKSSPSGKGSARAEQPLSHVEPIKADINVSAADYTNGRQMIFRQQARPSVPSTIGLPASDTQAVIGKIQEGIPDNISTDDSGKPSVPSEEQVSPALQAIPDQEEMTSPPGTTVSPTSDTQLASAEVQEVIPHEQQAVESITPLLSSGKQGSHVRSDFGPGEVGPAEKKFALSDQELLHEQSTSSRPRKEQTVVPTAEQIKEQRTIIGQQDTQDTREALTSEDALDTTPTHGDVQPTGSIEPGRRPLSVQGEESTSATQAPPTHVAKDSIDTEDISTDAWGNVQSLKPSTTPDARGIRSGSTPDDVVVAEQKSAMSGQDSADSAEPAFSLGPRNKAIRDSTPSALVLSSTNPSKEDAIVARPDQAKDSQTTPSRQDILSTQRPLGKVQENIPGDDLGEDKPLRASSAVREGKPSKEVPASAPGIQLGSVPNKVALDEQKFALSGQDSAYPAQPPPSAEPRSKGIRDLAHSTQLNSTTGMRNGDDIVAAPDQAKDSQTTPGQQVKLSAPSSYTQHPSGTLQEDEPADNSGEMKSSEPPSVVREGKPVAAVPVSSLDTGQGSAHTTMPAALGARYGAELHKADVDEQKIASSGQDSVRSVQPSFSTEPTKEDAVVAATDQTSTLEKIIDQSGTKPAPGKAKTPFLGTPDASKETQKSTDDNHIDAKPPGQGRVSSYRHVSEQHKQPTADAHSDVVYKDTTLGSNQAETSNARPDSTPTGGDARLSSGDVPAANYLPETQNLQDSAYTQNIPSDSSGKNESPGHLSTDQAMAPRMSPSVPSVAPLGTNSVQPPRQASIASTVDLGSFPDTQCGIPQGEATPAEQKFAVSDQEPPHTSEPPSSAEPRKEEANAGAGDQPNVPHGQETTARHQVKAPSPDAREALRKDHEPSHAVLPEQKLERRTPEVGSTVVDKETTHLSRQAQTSATEPGSTPISGDVPPTSSLQNQDTQPPVTTQAPSTRSLQGFAPTQDDFLRKFESPRQASTDQVIAPVMSSAAPSDAPQGQDSAQSIKPPFSTEPTEDKTVVRAPDQTKDMDTITHQQATTPAPDTAKTPFPGTDQEEIPSIAGPTSMDPQLASTLPAELAHSQQKPAPSEKGSARAAQPLSPVEPIKADNDGSAADYMNASQMIFRQRARPSIPSTIGIPGSDTQAVIGKIKEGNPDNLSTDDSGKPSIPSQEQVSPASQAIPDQEEMTSPPGTTVSPTSDTQLASAEVQEVIPHEQQAVESITPLLSSGKQGSHVRSDFGPGEVGPVEKKFAPSDQELPHSAEQFTSSKPKKEQTVVPTAEQIKEQPTIIGQQDTQDRREALTSEDVLDTTPTHGDVQPTGSVEPDRRPLSVQGEESTSATQAPPPHVANDSLDTEDISTDALGNIQSLRPSTIPDARGIPPRSTPDDVAVAEQKSSLPGQDSADPAEAAFSLGPRDKEIKDSTPSALVISSTDPSKGDAIVAGPDEANDSQTTPSRQDLLSTQHPSGKVQENIPDDDSGKDKPLRAFSTVREGQDSAYPAQPPSSAEPRSKAIGDLVPSTQLNSTTGTRNGDGIFAASDQAKDSSAEPRKEEANAARDQPNVPQGPETTVPHQVKSPSPDAREAFQKDQQLSRDDDHISNSANPRVASEEKASHAGRASEGPTSEVSGAVVDKKMTFPSSQAQTSSTGPESTPLSGDSHLSSTDVLATSSLQNEEVQDPAATQVPTRAPIDSASTQNVPTGSLGEITSAAVSDAPQGTEPDEISTQFSESPFSAEPSNEASHAGRASESHEGTTRQVHSPAVDAKTTLPIRQVQTANTGPDSTPISDDVPDRSSLQNQEAQPSAATQGPTVQAQNSASTKNEPVDSLGDIKSKRQLPTVEVVTPTSFTAPSDSSQVTDPDTNSVQPSEEASFDFSGDQAKTLPNGDLPASQVVGQSESADSQGMDSQNNLEEALTDDNPKIQQQNEPFDTQSSIDNKKEADRTGSNLSTTFEDLQKQPSRPKGSMELSDELENQQHSLEENGNQAEQSKAHDTLTGGPEDMEASENTNQKNNKMSQVETFDHSRKEASAVKQLGENTKDAPNSTEDVPGDVQAISRSKESSRSSEESMVQLQSEDKISETEAPSSETRQPRGDLQKNSYQNNSSQSQAEASDKSVEQSYPGIQNKDRDSGRLDDSTDSTKPGDMEDESR